MFINLLSISTPNDPILQKDFNLNNFWARYQESLLLFRIQEAFGRELEEEAGTIGQEKAIGFE